jgi:hypothetical protein
MKMIRTGLLGAICAGALVSGQPVAAQTAAPQGWPEAAAPPVNAKPVAKPAATVARPAVVSTAKAATTPVTTPAAPAAASTTTPEAVIALARLPELLQQHSEVLARLGAQIDAQRTLIASQQQRIDALEAARSIAVAPAPTAPAAAAAAPAKVTPPPPPALPPLVVETGGIKLKLSGLFQGWYTATSGATVDSFRLRRTELKFSGDMSSRVKWTVMVDPSKALSLSTSSATVGGQQVLTGSSIGQSGRVLQDAFASVVVTPALIFDLGQQKLPLSMEGPHSSGRLDVVERALFLSDRARGGGYGDVRDLGLMARGKLAAGQIEYFAGVFNGLGESQNDLDRNDQKEVAMRVILRPTLLNGLHFGGSFARDGVTALSATGRERHGLEFVYARGRMGVKSELMMGRDGAVTRRGGYAQATHRVHRSVQAVFRFDTWDPDTRTGATADTVTERDWLGGVTYTIANSGAWLQLNYVRKTFADVVPARNVFIANIQSTW